MKVMVKLQDGKMKSKPEREKGNLSLKKWISDIYRHEHVVLIS